MPTRAVPHEGRLAGTCFDSNTHIPSRRSTALLRAETSEWPVRRRGAKWELPDQVVVAFSSSFISIAGAALPPRSAHAGKGRARHAEHVCTKGSVWFTSSLQELDFHSNEM